MSRSSLHETIKYQDIVESIGGRKIQQGMNYRVNGKYSIFLMNTSSRARYSDRHEGGNLIYEGHDISTRKGIDPKSLDQPERNRNGSLTTNGKFFEAAIKYKTGQINEPESVRVYEKLQKNVWIDRGFFSLIDARKENASGRVVFKFRLIPYAIEQAIENKDNYIVKEVLATERRIIATARIGQDLIRKQTLASYSNQCAMCDIDDPELLVASHIVPWSEDKSTRGWLENIICLCVLHDALFEQGKINLNDNYKIEFSNHFLRKCYNESNIYSVIKQATKAQLRMPKDNIPSKESLIRHRARAR